MTESPTIEVFACQCGRTVATKPGDCPKCAEDRKAAGQVDQRINLVEARIDSLRKAAEKADGGQKVDIEERLANEQQRIVRLQKRKALEVGAGKLEKVIASIRPAGPGQVRLDAPLRPKHSATVVLPATHEAVKGAVSQAQRATPPEQKGENGRTAQPAAKRERSDQKGETENGSS